MDLDRELVHSDDPLAACVASGGFVTFRELVWSLPLVAVRGHYF